MTDHDIGRMSRRTLEQEVVKLRHLLSVQMSAAPGTGDEVVVQGIVAIGSNEPIVQMRAGEAAWQFTTQQARQHALIVLNAAVEAERDAATIAFLAETGMDEQEAGGFLHLMREHRKEWFA